MIENDKILLEFLGFSPIFSIDKILNILNIEIDGSIKSVEIYSLHGQKVLSADNKEINISNLASGMYIVKVQDLNGSYATKKLIIE